MYHLPTFDEAVDLCERNNSFIHSIHVIDGYEVHNFSYRLASYNDFKDNNAFEFRGLCFVKQNDGSMRSFRMLHKFFNLNENEDTQYDQLKNKKISYVQTKFDGTLIRFIELPNGRIIAKTKNGFDSEYCQKAMELFEANEDIQALVFHDIEYGVATFFELIGFEKIVLSYEKPELVLIQRRWEGTGNYIPIDEINEEDFSTTSIQYSRNDFADFDSLIDTAESLEDFEGWVITFSDGFVIKLKCAWYFAQHKMLDALQHEDVLISLILNEKVDDLLATLNGEDKQFVMDMDGKVNGYVRKVSQWVYDIVDTHHHYGTSRKDFANEWKDNKHFHLMMKIYNDPTIENAIEAVKRHVLKITYHREEARKFLKEIN